MVVVVATNGTASYYIWEDYFFYKGDAGVVNFFPIILSLKCCFVSSHFLVVLLLCYIFIRESEINVTHIHKLEEILFHYNTNFSL